jgi:purine-binding chemotaxis protein CheW
MPQVETEQDAAHLLTIFAICETLFAVSAQFVQEIIRLCPITPVHHAPRHVAGIINLRGRIVTVLDPAQRIGLGVQEAGETSRILILDWKGEQLGLLVSRVRDVLPIAPERLVAPPPNLRSVLGPFSAQVFQIQDNIVSTLNLEALLATDQVP